MEFLNNWFNYFSPSKPELKTEDTEEDGPQILWIHGAGQSGTSFNYMRSQLPKWPSTIIEYSTEIPFRDNINTIKEQLDPETPSFVVAHSMGGLYGLHLVESMNIIGGVSISTPLNGLAIADWGRYILPKYNLFQEVGRRSAVVTDAKDISLNIPWLQVITTDGNVPYLEGPNDGVCTIKSMTPEREDMDSIEINHTHYEIICSNTICDIVKERYNKHL